MANTFHYNRGGDSTYTFQLTNLLHAHGHNIVHFAMNHPQNYPSTFSRYFVPEIDFIKELNARSINSVLRVAHRSLYSRISKVKIYELLSRYPVDIAHIHNIRGHISLSIFHILKTMNIPIVWTLHDYFLLCPNSTFYGTSGTCELCGGNRFFHVVLKKCRKNSLAASMVVMIEEYLQRIMGLLRLVDFFIAPSIFMKDKMIEYGFPRTKIKYLPYCIETKNGYEEKEKGKYGLYIGRISYEKGLSTLIEAWANIPNAKLVIAGDGPLRTEKEKIVKDLNLKNIIFLGNVPSLKIPDIIRNASFLITPSEWYENYPYSIMEAFSQGKPVIGSRIGGIPEMVIDGITGLLFNPGDKNDLTDKIRWLLAHPAQGKILGLNAYEFARKKFNPSDHYREIIELYDCAQKGHKKIANEQEPVFNH